jgi:Spy/CpxP family protein refolding chaperone
MKRIIPLLMMLFLFISTTDAQNRQRKPQPPNTPEVPEIQNGPGRGFENLPGLTDEQREKLKEFRISHQKEMQKIHNELAEMRAHLKTLTDDFEKPDMDEINKTIDEITSKINAEMKNRTKHMEDLKKILDDEQWMRFKNNPGPGPFGPMGPNSHGPGRGRCNCPCANP